jgi:soluble lytic murein transglycosylase
MFGASPTRPIVPVLRRGVAAVCWLVAVACGAQEETPDSARGPVTPARYDSLAERESEIADWLSLRAAALTQDAGARAARYAPITIPAAKDRIPWVEARAREKFGDTAGAIASYTKLGAKLSVFRLRAATSKTAKDSQTVRDELLAYISAANNTAAVRDGFTLFDKLAKKHTVSEQLAIARAAAAFGQWSRARSGYAASIDRARVAPVDRFRYAMALANGNEDAKAAAQYAKIKTPVSLAAAASYQRARALLALGENRKATAALKSITERYPNDTSAAAALSLLADLASDDLDDARARTLLLQVARRFPSTRFGAPARFNAALLAYVLGDDRTAIAELAPIAITPSELSAQYWLGRAQERSGGKDSAKRTWQTLIGHDSTSYYAVLAARRLDRDALRDMPDETPVPRVASVDSGLRRIALLRAQQMTAEIRYETERLAKDAPSNRDRLIATASAFAGTDQSGRAIALGRRALADYGASAQIYRLMYPVAARDTIVDQAKANEIDPVLVAALIRQESNFNPGATSPAGARGLMQLMPAVARLIAPSKRISPWNAGRLYEPGTNIVLGVAHLAPLLKRYPHVTHALAAYNAGESRVTRWLRKRGSDDPELFTERIPFGETREYVKSIIRNREMYRALYSWP